MSGFLRVVAAVMLLAASAAPGFARQSPPPNPTAQSPRGGDPGPVPEPGGERREYVIGAGDLLEIAVWDNVAISRTVPVRPDGKISLPVLHDVEAAGLTPMQLQTHLNKALARFVQEPAVSVIVREIHSFKVSVIGEVKTPGRFELADAATVMDVLALAGGFTEFADRGRIVILRREGDHTKQIPFAYDKAVSHNESAPAQKNVRLRPNDVVVVP